MRYLKSFFHSKMKENNRYVGILVAIYKAYFLHVFSIKIFETRQKLKLIKLYISSSIIKFGEIISNLALYDVNIIKLRIFKYFYRFCCSITM